MPTSLPIGLVFDFDLGYPRGVVRGVKRFAHDRPDWLLMPLDERGATAEALRALRPAGIIALVAGRPLADALRAVGRPVVDVASVLPGLPFPLVRVDHRAVGRLAAESLRDRGFTSFGYVGHPRHVYSAEREAGFRAALDPDRHTCARFHDPSARRRLVLNPALPDWLRTLPTPVGVFAGHDVWAVQVVEACRLAGLRVPDDVAVVGVDNDDLLCDLTRPSLSSIGVPAERIGFEAAALLDRLLRGGRPPKGPVLVPPTGLVGRDSTDVLAVSDPVVAAAVRFIRDRGSRPISVSDVLREVTVSRRVLEQRFRAAFDRGVGEVIRRAHLDRARELLASTPLPLAEVAERSGFSGVPYLCRTFRRELGVTPVAYRRRVSDPTGG